MIRRRLCDQRKLLAWALLVWDDFGMWGRGRWLGIAVAMFLGVLGLETAAAVASPIRSGASYQGSGSQQIGQNGVFAVQFRVARTGRELTQLQLSRFLVPCNSGQLSATTFGVGSARIQANDTFRVAISPEVNATTPAWHAFTVSGRFLRHGRARGTLRFRGSGPLAGCNTSGIWTAVVTAHLPPEQIYSGTTDQGTPVTFLRVLGAHPHVKSFDFGALHSTTGCYVASGVITLSNPVPPGNYFVLPVVEVSGQPSFGGLWDYGGDYLMTVNGTFANGQATGTVSYTDRGNCYTGVVQWTAYPLLVN
jgi:hypothetical protein